MVVDKSAVARRWPVGHWEKLFAQDVVIQDLHDERVKIIHTSEVMKEGNLIRAKLIEMGWTPPDQHSALREAAIKAVESYWRGDNHEEMKALEKVTHWYVWDSKANVPDYTADKSVDDS